MAQSDYSSVSASSRSTRSTRSSRSSGSGESDDSNTSHSRSSHRSARDNIRSTNLALPKDRKAIACIVWFAGGDPGVVKHIRRDDVIYPPFAKPRFHFVKSRRFRTQPRSPTDNASDCSGLPPNMARDQAASDISGGFAGDSAYIDADADAMRMPTPLSFGAPGVAGPSAGPRFRGPLPDGAVPSTMHSGGLIHGFLGRGGRAGPI
ncbi:hypothetical protein SEPCBS57363_000376 [Sporothrix epigloea]|uniref:Uncharacterized protein n=1 Tax=Sporothrix epigloea TaxID=1892477 RepID=A0ABP0D4B0_9PEZI